MTSRLLHRLLFSILLILPVLQSFPPAAEAWMAPQWIDKIELEVMVQKNTAKTGNFDPYFKQLEVITEAAVKEAYDGKRKGMNRFWKCWKQRKAGSAPRQRIEFLPRSSKWSPMPCSFL